MSTTQPTRVPGAASKPTEPVVPVVTVSTDAAKGSSTVTHDTSPQLEAMRAAEAAGLAAVAAANASAGVTPLKVTAPLKGSVEEQVASLKAQVEELNRHNVELTSAATAMLKQLQKAEVGIEKTLAAPKLPTLAAAIKDVEARVARGESVHAVATEEGNYVHPLAGYQAQPGAALDAKAQASLVATMVAAMQGAAAHEAAKPKKAETIMEAGKPPKDE